MPHIFRIQRSLFLPYVQQGDVESIHLKSGSLPLWPGLFTKPMYLEVQITPLIQYKYKPITLQLYHMLYIFTPTYHACIPNLYVLKQGNVINSSENTSHLPLNDMATSHFEIHVMTYTTGCCHHILIGNILKVLYSDTECRLSKVSYRCIVPSSTFEFRISNWPLIWHSNRLRSEHVQIKW